MPYLTLADLPKRIQKLPHHAQEIYRKAFNNAWREYASPIKRRYRASREETAHRVAWNAIKHSYQKVGEGWVRS